MGLSNPPTPAIFYSESNNLDVLHVDNPVFRYSNTTKHFKKNYEIILNAETSKLCCKGDKYLYLNIKEITLLFNLLQGKGKLTLYDSHEVED